MKSHFTPYIYILLSILFFNHSFGQKLELKISSNDSTSNSFLQNISYQKYHLSEKSILNTLDSVTLQIEKIGFFNHQLDSLIKKDSIYTAYFKLNNQIKIIRIHYNINQISFEPINPNYFEVAPKNLTKKLQQIVTTQEEKGNSFSEASLQNITVINDTIIEAQLALKKSSKRKIDKIIITGYSNFSKAFLKHHLQLKEHTLFNKNKLNKASMATNNLSFSSEIKAPEVLFTKDSTIVYLFIKKEKANRFDGLIGFTTNETGKGLSFNGYLDLLLNNIFDSGENIDLSWKNNGNNQHSFNLDVSLPFIFNTRISPNVALSIYKQDSTFVNTSFKLTLPYHINNRNAIGLTMHSENSSNLLTNTITTIEDYKSTFFGINYNYTIANNHPLFKTKFNFYIEGLKGKRTNTNSNKQSKFNLQTNFLWSLNHKNHIFLQNRSGIINSKNLLTNELFRVGGNNSIRGFDEESIPASTYTTFNIEYRYATNNSSYLYSITDFGSIKNQNESSQLYSLGLGYAFLSKLGYINLGYAIGKYPNNSFNINNSRIHLKIVNLF